jgi:hypothetical protein
MENKEKVMLKMRQMSIEEKIAMLSDKDEAYVRGFIEGTIFWICHTAQQNKGGKAEAAAKLKSKKATKKAEKNI